MPVVRPDRSARRHLALRAACLTVGAVALLSLGAGCQSKCTDDGFAWQQDAACVAALTQSGSGTESAEDSDSDSDSQPTEGSNSNTDGPPTTSVTSGDGVLWCKDADGDSFGDPDMCTELPEGEQGPAGTVPDSGDCNDGDPDTFPGAAENDSPTACMQDGDDDGYGDDSPDPGPNPDAPVEPGSDCDDGSEGTFPGAAENDSPTACMKDVDDDGYGDQDPPAGVDAGTDCDDAEPNAWTSCGACMDADGDGYYTMCDTYPPGKETPDCDDASADTFPGAAPNDDVDACMTDADGDDWGDDTPSGPGVEPGTDCDDADANTYTGAADIEDPSACMADGDDDGWGDADPPDGVTPGSDCVDGQAAINPDDSVLVTMPTSTGEVLEVSLTDGAMTPIASVDVAMFDPWLPTSVAINPNDLTVVVALAMSGKLATMNYCGGGAPTEMAGAHNKELCGLAFDGAGKLYGVDGEVDQIVMFEADGSIMPGNIKPLTFEGAPLNIAKCGMTYDCHNDRILLADSNTASIYAVNPGDGTTTRLAFIEEGAFGAGLAYEPVEQVALSCNGVGMYAIALDGSNTSMLLPDLAKAADDLEFAPGCD